MLSKKIIMGTHDISYSMYASGSVTSGQNSIDSPGLLARENRHCLSWGT